MMLWLLVCMLVLAAIVLAGRAHSRYLDRLEAEPAVVILLKSLPAEASLAIEPSSSTRRWDSTSRGCDERPPQSVRQTSRQ
jgi:hypothetical protein